MADIHPFPPRLEQQVAREQAALHSTVPLKSAKGAIRACEHNARVLMAQAPQYHGLHYDEFLARSRIDGRDWTDADDLEAACWLQSAHNVPAFRLTQAHNGAKALANTRRRDSLREFIRDLPEWDETPRIVHAFVDAWGAPDTLLTRAASRNFFIALIARAEVPGAQVDTLWTFEGRQGTFKSQSLRALGGGIGGFHRHKAHCAPLHRGGKRGRSRCAITRQFNEVCECRLLAGGLIRSRGSA